VQIFNHHQHWSDSGQASDKLADRLDQPTRVRHRRIRSWCEAISERNAELWEQPNQIRSERREHIGRYQWGAGGQKGAQQIEQRRIWCGAIGLKAAPFKHIKAAAARLCGYFSNEARFANACLTAQAHNATLACAHLFDDGGQHRQGYGAAQ
jgi:hypothetical protein